MTGEEALLRCDVHGRTRWLECGRRRFWTLLSGPGVYPPEDHPYGMGPASPPLLFKSKIKGGVLVVVLANGSISRP